LREDPGGAWTFDHPCDDVSRAVASSGPWLLLWLLAVVIAVAVAVAEVSPATGARASLLILGGVLVVLELELAGGIESDIFRLFVEDTTCTKDG